MGLENRSFDGGLSCMLRSSSVSHQAVVRWSRSSTWSSHSLHDMLSLHLYDM